MTKKITRTYYIFAVSFKARMKNKWKLLTSKNMNWEDFSPFVFKNRPDWKPCFTTGSLLALLLVFDSHALPLIYPDSEYLNICLKLFGTKNNPNLPSKKS